MRKRELAELLARIDSVSPAQAADNLDQAVRKILKALRRGDRVSLPGVGVLEQKRSTAGRVKR